MVSDSVRQPFVTELQDQDFMFPCPPPSGYLDVWDPGDGTAVISELDAGDVIGAISLPSMTRSSVTDPGW